MNTNQSSEYIDLGLPSGTLWKRYNEADYYTWEKAMNQFKDNLPTIEQLDELVECCTWEWTGIGYKIKGPNGKFIRLHADGWTDDSDKCYELGECGSYWSSTQKESKYTGYLDFSSDDVWIYFNSRNYKRSVRLVKNNNSNLNQQ